MSPASLHFFRTVHFHPAMFCFRFLPLLTFFCADDDTRTIPASAILQTDTTLFQGRQISSEKIRCISRVYSLKAKGIEREHTKGCCSTENSNLTILSLTTLFQPMPFSCTESQVCRISSRLKCRATPDTPASTLFNFFIFQKLLRACLQRVKVSSQSDEWCVLW